MTAERPIWHTVVDTRGDFGVFFVHDSRRPRPVRAAEWLREALANFIAAMRWGKGGTAARLISEVAPFDEWVSKETIRNWIPTDALKAKSTKSQTVPAARFLRYLEPRVRDARTPIDLRKIFSAPFDDDHVLTHGGDELCLSCGPIQLNATFGGPLYARDPVGAYVEALAALFWALCDESGLGYVAISRQAVGDVLGSVGITWGSTEVEDVLKALGMTTLGYFTARPPGAEAAIDDLAEIVPVAAGRAEIDPPALVGKPLLGRHASVNAWWFLAQIQVALPMLDQPDREALARYLLGIPPNDNDERRDFQIWWPDRESGSDDEGADSDVRDDS